MDVNDDEGRQDERGVPATIASELAPTGSCVDYLRFTLE